MSEDEIDLQLKILEIEESTRESLNSIDYDMSQKPEWWQMAIGFKDASEREYQEARKIFKEFLAFSAPKDGKHYAGHDFDSLVKKFTMAKMMNKIQRSEG